MLKRILAGFIVISMLITCIPLFVIADDYGMLTWEERADIDNNKTRDREWFWRPYPDARSQQNPPDFSWPYVGGATSYDLVIATDKKCENVVKRVEGISNNFYNFTEQFETGVTYYWSVRYHTDMAMSEWSEPLRFLILPEAYTVEGCDVDKLIEIIKSYDHPKNLITKNNINEFRTYKDKYESSKKVFDSIETAVKGYMETGILDESNNSTADTVVYNSAFYYIITQDRNVGEFAKKQLLEIASWDVNGKTSYSANSTQFRELLLYSAVAYDWLYDLLTEEEKSKIIKMIRERLIIYEDPPDGNTDKARNMWTTPYVSHGWTAVRCFLIGTCTIMCNEIPEADEFLRKYLPLYLNVIPPFSNEDGMWGQGIEYWSYDDNNHYPMILNELTGFNVYQKAYYQNEILLPIYLISEKNIVEFSENYGNSYNTNHDTNLRKKLFLNPNPYMKWKWDKMSLSSLTIPFLYVINARLEQMDEGEAPLHFPRSHAFTDTGIVAMHSDIINEGDKISLYFKSSPFGSNSHSHPDQNTFHIQAYGEKLAIDSGYYESYLSDFDQAYTRQTFAHNGITYNGGIGQPYAAPIADGDITNFLTHPDFDLTSGSAADAYNYNNGGSEFIHNIDKADRFIIYVRPNHFVVIDDLKAAESQQVNFEWWLNGYEDISLYESRTGAQIVKGNAALDAKIQYPKVTGYYSDVFSGPDLVAHYPKSGGPVITKRVWFETPKVNKTKMITTMGVHHKNDNPTYVDTVSYDNYMLLTFDDGTKVYAATGDGPINAVNVVSDAVAVVTNGDSIMMVDGTYLEYRGEKIIESDKKASVVIGKDELGVSAYTDVNLWIATNEVKTLKTFKGFYEDPNQNSRGFDWNYSDGKLNIKAYKGFYSYYINDKAIPGAKLENQSMKYTINGEEKEVLLSGYVNHDGDAVLSGNIVNDTGYYIIEEIEGVRLNNARKGERLLLGKDAQILVIGDNASFKLNSLVSQKVETVKYDNPDEIKGKLNVFEEAENFVSKQGNGKKYTSRSFLSGGAGVSKLDILGDYMTWELNVPEAGNYDVVVKYVGWASTTGSIERMISLNEKDFLGANLHETGSYGATPEEWIAERIKTNISLKKGINTLTLYPLSGQWNIDWVGLVKSDK